MSCSIAIASGRVALRANMGGSCIHRECFLRLLQRRPNLHGSGTPRYVVDGQNLLQLQCAIELRIGLNTATRIIFRQEMLQLAALLNTQLNGLADHLVRMPEWHSIAN